ncbi:CRISPR-associated protein Cas5 [Pontibacter qinzhouensis]|uniref:CRISPR-associated protein Cas5 n=1 Tax=Pontibacter qinzhouensis TaxID=2603253 RepID=A0A5C8J7V2_9BACT|nr:CRISPR-associated protein Cas5 [Pontibacter qinzhouensis]TXK33283.1 CRISPR-associated protein Cas5 [Pontibacter qinzhouensis]
MKILTIDIYGKMAHFRKYYGNNTAMSYSLPPRTTVMGMLAAVLGYERDSYYSILASDKIRIGLRVLSPLKKSFHRLNLLSIKSLGDATKGGGDFSGKGGRIQTPFEVVSGMDISKDMVCYRIFISAHQAGTEIFSQLIEKLQANQRHFNLTLGVANFSAFVRNVRLYENVTATNSSGTIQIHSAVISDTVEKLLFEKDTEAGSNFLEEELLPSDFLENGSRELSKLNRTLFSTRNLPLEVSLSVPHYQLVDETETQNIVFLE